MNSVRRKVALTAAMCLGVSATAAEPVTLLDSGPKLDCLLGLTQHCLFSHERPESMKFSVIVAIDWLTPELVFHGLLTYGTQYDAVDHWFRRGPDGTVDESRFVVTYAARPYCTETVVTCDRGDELWRCSAEASPSPMETGERAAPTQPWPRCRLRIGATMQPVPPLTDSFPDVAYLVRAGGSDLHDYGLRGESDYAHRSE